jgi:hypothetical protein
VPESPEILALLPDAKVLQEKLPDAVDLSEYLLTYSKPSVRAACPSSIVCTKLVEYFNYRCLGRIEPMSARFVTRAVNQLAHGDCSGIRANLKAIRQFGIPPKFAESCRELDAYDYDLAQFGYADDFQSMQYVRLGSAPKAESPVQSLKAWLTRGFPIAFGFAVPSSLDCDGYIEYRPTFDSILGGHAALLVGFDDKQLSASRGAFRVYCPWGSNWGEQGFGWLPYTFAERRMALDFWTIMKPEWATSGELFGSA